MMTEATYHKWVRLRDADKFMRVGWLPIDTLIGTIHAYHGIHMIWLCDCEVVSFPQDGK